MGKQYCMNCFRKVDAYPCPCCGYEGPEIPDSQALTGNILAGRYLTGRVLHRTGLEYTYKGLDLAHRRGVQIQEYFPTGHALRSMDGTVLWQGESLREAGTASFLHGAVETDAEMPAVDSFLENGTAYIIRRKKPAPQEPDMPENPWVPFLIAFVAVLLVIVFLLAIVRNFPAAETVPEPSVPAETYSQELDEAGSLRAETYRDDQGLTTSVLHYDSSARLIRKDIYTNGALTAWAELIYDSNGNYLETVMHTVPEA